MCEGNKPEMVDILTVGHLDSTLVQSGKPSEQGNIKGNTAGLAVPRYHQTTGKVS